MKVYYFGTNGEPGHYLYDDQMNRVRSFDLKQTPFGVKIDAGLLDKTKQQVEGEAVLVHHSSGWTALSFWNRTDDKRSGCNSAFIVDDVCTFDEMISIASVTFPKLMGRFKFGIRLA